MATYKKITEEELLTAAKDYTATRQEIENLLDVTYGRSATENFWVAQEIMEIAWEPQK